MAVEVTGAVAEVGVFLFVAPESVRPAILRGMEMAMDGRSLPTAALGKVLFAEMMELTKSFPDDENRFRLRVRFLPRRLGDCDDYPLATRVAFAYRP